MRRYILSVIILAFVSVVSAFARNNDLVLGKWTTYDKHGNPESEVLIYQAGDGYNCKVTKLLGKFAGMKDPVCEGCPDDYRDKPVVGLDIVRGMKYDGKIFNGKILSPNQARIFRMTMQIDSSNEDVLVVKGYLGPFSETQRWKRIR